ncbi:hypothetical protein [Streptomyces sp. NEAU-NA10]|uniref:hypothetical protein n=1 Tax=Streptomyces sp. NEAU-NA10 TaxID=3416050 RepID=UPI003CC6B35F
MTQSGQGEEPSARPAREGIVLPSDGGEPLLPGTTNSPYDSPQQYGQQAPQASAPAGGQTWGQPWGPDQQQPGQGWPLPADQQWDTPQPTAPDAWGAPSGQGAGPLPPQGAPAPTYGQGTPAAPLPPPADEGATQYIPPVTSAPAADGATQYIPPVTGSAAVDGATQYIPPVPSTPADDGATQYIPPVSAAPADEGATQYLPPVGPGALPPETPSESTHYLGRTPQNGPGPMPGAGAPPGAGAGSHPGAGAHAGAGPLPGAGASPFPGADAHSGAGPLPGSGAHTGADFHPGAGAHASAGPLPGTPSHPGAGPLPTPGSHPGPLPGAANPDAEATQYIPPVTGQGPYGGPGGAGGDRQPPAGFENLFRDGPGGDGPAGSTQQLPRFSEPEGVGHGGYGTGPGHPGGQPSYAPPGAGRRGVRDDDHGRGRWGSPRSSEAESGGGRTGSRVPLFAALGVGLAVVGIGAGAMLAGGGGGDDAGDNKTVAASAPATQGSASASADPAEQQAIALDKLLADSGSSRASVISAVADVKACNNLAQAASDLRDAAKQRNELVTKLSGLAVDRLPDHEALTTALTKAWQASASADNHYAAWADQVAGGKKQSCKKGTARTTPQTQAGNRESGTASIQKAQAAKLWNEIAKKYGLTQRQPTQL